MFRNSHVVCAIIQ